MVSEKIITIPNILSSIRILLVPFFIFSMNMKDYSMALKILILAGLTDCLDGLIARKFNQISKLGIFLDPLADKLLVIGIMATFYINQLVPKWFLLIVFTRDVLVAIGWLEAYFRRRKLMKPLLLGKLCNASQVIIYSYVLLALNFNLPEPSTFIYFLVSSLSIISFLQYSVERLMNENQRS